MLRKKYIIFVIESLALAGSEKSLIALLSKLDYDRYDVDLQMFKYGSELEKYIPRQVNVLPPLKYTKFSSESWKTSIAEMFFKGKFAYFFVKLWYSLKLRLRKRNHSEISRLYWESTKSVFEPSKKEYDAAIAYAQGVPTFYVIDKLKAKKKITWVNANMQFESSNLKFQESYYSQFDTIIPVTEGTKEHLIKIFPRLTKKFIVIPDIVDYSSILQMANAYETTMKKNKYNILTVSRLDDGMKGMDITIETCRILRDRGFDFHWYILGKGSFKNTMEEFIEEHALQDCLKLIGTTDNPYPYFKEADLYVQTSRKEGYGLTLVEARLLNTPIVTTRFDTVFIQMVDGKNGLVTDIDSYAVADAVEKIMNDKELYSFIKQYLEQEEKENYESVEKFNELI